MYIGAIGKIVTVIPSLYLLCVGKRMIFSALIKVFLEEVKEVNCEYSFVNKMRSYLY